ncbi:hypothetical protein EDC01DRAFT_64325 [Geopyxis carbonaria]|nr:hypothetical protein EDC01DRAFT_64325 [Geopyxis carbonaria]
MILLLDLYERPQSPEASRSRIFVDEVFALFGEHGNYATEDGEICPRPLKDGGCEAWALLARLRRRGVSRARLGEVNGIPNDLDEWSQQQQQQQQARVATSTNTPYFTPLNDDMGASHLDPDGLQELSRLVGVDVDLQCATDGAGMMELDLTREDIDWKEWDQIFGRFVDMAEEGSAAAAAAAAAAARTGLTDVSRGGLAQLQWGIGGIEDS